ncbi:MAG: ABC transporter ATP-binding protein, partial [Chloroflexi bacterium]|nr:ABC transporter ATP-binding protein [Chloroflexota bacterium]
MTFLLRKLGLHPVAVGGLIAVFRLYRWPFLFVFLAAIAVPFLELAFITSLYWTLEPGDDSTLISWYNSNVVSHITDDPDSNTPILILALILLVTAVASRFLFRYVLARLAYSIYKLITFRLIRAYLRAPHHHSAFVDKEALSNAIVSEADHYSMVPVNLVGLATIPVSLAVFVFAAYTISPPLVGVVALIGVLVIFVSWRRYRIVMRLGALAVQMRSALLAFATDTVGGITPIKSRGAEARTAERSEEFINRTQQYRFDAQLNILLLDTTTTTIMLAALFGSVFIASSTSALSVAGVLIFLVLMTRIQRLVQDFQARTVKMRGNIPAVRMVESLISDLEAVATPTADDAIGPGEIRKPLRSLRLENVEFSYPDGVQVLRGASLELKAGDRVLLQGPSGGGKTTILKIIAGLLKPASGNVLINGASTESEADYGPRNRISFVSNDLQVFRDSARMNLTLDSDRSDSEIIKALEAVRLDSRLLGDLDEPVGENGGWLSVGQRQRLLLAPLFFDPLDLILLDETTANVERSLQIYIMTTLLDHISEDAIVVVVAHRIPDGIKF